MIITGTEGWRGRKTAGGRDINAICKADETVCSKIVYVKGEINKWLPLATSPLSPNKAAFLAADRTSGSGNVRAAVR